MSIEDFEELLETIEDLAVVAERCDEPTISHVELKARSMRDGLLPTHRLQTDV